MSENGFEVQGSMRLRSTPRAAVRSLRDSILFLSLSPPLLFSSFLYLSIKRRSIDVHMERYLKLEKVGEGTYG